MKEKFPDLTPECGMQLPFPAANSREFFQFVLPLLKFLLSLSGQIGGIQKTVGEIFVDRRCPGIPDIEQFCCFLELGMSVRAESTITAVEGRTVTFEVSAYDDAGLIGSGTHQRVLIDDARFLSKAQSKGEVKS